MKQLKLTFLLTLLMSIVGTNTFAHDIEVANADGVIIYYNWINSNTELSVSYRGWYDGEFSNEYNGSVVIPETVTYNGTAYPVTSIDNEAFRGCPGLTSVTIGNSVTSIGNSAFYGCSGLISVTIGNSVTSIGSSAFSGCSSLSSVHISDLAVWCNIQFNSYDSNPLYYAHHLYLNGEEVTELVIPNGVTSINNCAFTGCTELTSVTIPNSVTNIGYGVFDSCSSLTSVIIGNSVTSIGGYAFSGCSNLSSVHISDLAAWCNIQFNSYGNPLYYAHHLYLNGKEVTELVIPNGVTSINNSAFEYCTELTSVTIPNSVTSIGNGVFSSCSSLTNVTIGNSVTSIGDYAFSTCSGLTGIIIGNSVTTIGNFAFYNCIGLTSITVPNSVTSIGNYAFNTCSSLTSVIIGNSVTSIGDYAFYQCSGLTSFFIPTSVSSINSSVFTGCTNLSEIQVNANNASFCSLDGVLMNKDMTSVIAFPDAKESFVLPASVTSLNPTIMGSKIKSFQIADSDTPLALMNGTFSFNNVETIYIGRNITLPSNSYSSPFSGIKIKSVVFGNKVTNIVQRLFYYSHLQAVTIPSSVTAIDVNAFSGCSHLDKVNYLGTINQWLNISFSDNPLHNNTDLYLNDLPISELTFANINGTVGTQLRGCTNLRSLIVASGNTSFDENAFSDCTSLEKVTIPKSVVTINNKAFNNCNNLDAVYYNGTLDDWFAMTLTANPLLYGADMYLNNTLLTNAVVPSSVTQIGTQLRGCTSLETVTIPVGVTDILDYAFRDCKSLSSVSVPSGVTSIGNYAFGDCISLTSVTIPSSVTSLSSTAFSGCTSLQSINFSGSANYTTIDGVVYDKDVTRIITYPQAKSSTTYTYPSTITTLGGIRDNSFLKRIYVPKLSSTPSINTYTFNVGENLVAVEFEDEIGDYYTKDGVVYKKYEYNGESQNYLVYCPRGKKSLTISPDVKYVYVDGFRPTSKLESITIEPSKQSISFYCSSSLSSQETAFHSPLKYLNIGRQLVFVNNNFYTLYSSQVFAQNPELTTVVIGENMTSIPDGLFTNCTKLSQVTLPETITSVGSKAFTGTPWLASLPTQDGVSYYNYIALEYKYSEAAKNVRLKDGISVVAGSLFENTDVESVAFPISVTNLENGLFYGCKSLKDVILPNSIRTIPGSLNIGYGTSHGFTPIDGVVENIHVPSSVTWIGRYAINQCDNVVIEDGNSNLQLQDRNAKDGYVDGTFSHVKKLYVGRNTALNGSSKSDMVFCALNDISTQLTDVIFGPLVTKAFTGWAFAYCNHVKSLTCLGKIPFASPNFNEIPQTAVLYVPLGSKEQYASADGWSRFGDIREVTEVTITMDDTEMVYASDFDLDFSNVDGLKAYVAGGFDAETSTITLNPVQLVSAGKGVILKGAKGTYTVPCTNIEPTAADALCGTISGRFIRHTEDENVNYAFDKVEHAFKPVDAAYGCLISRNGAYLSLPASSVGNGNKEITVLEPLTVTAKSYERVYGEENPKFEYEVTGGALDGTPVITCEATEKSPVGTYDIIVKRGTETYNNLTYYVKGTLTITKAPLKIKAGTYTKKRGKDNPEFTLTYEGFKNEETKDVLTKQPITTTTATKESAVGEYEVTVSGAEAQNYEISYTNGVLIIEMLLGDANGDGDVTEADVNAVANHIMGQTPTGFDKETADANEDKKVNAADIVTINNIIKNKK